MRFKTHPTVHVIINIIIDYSLLLLLLFSAPLLLSAYYASTALLLGIIIIINIAFRDVSLLLLLLLLFYFLVDYVRLIRHSYYPLRYPLCPLRPRIRAASIWLLAGSGGIIIH